MCRFNPRPVTLDKFEAIVTPWVDRFNDVYGYVTFKMSKFNGVLPFAMKCLMQSEGRTYQWPKALYTLGYGRLGIKASFPFKMDERIDWRLRGMGGTDYVLFLTVLLLRL